MTAQVVVDVGNSRLKWGWWADGHLSHFASVAPDPMAWTHLAQTPPWHTHQLTWTIAGVVPARVAAFAAWVQTRGETSRVVANSRQVGVPVALPHPERVGIDRLLNARGARTRLPPNTPAIIADIGTAVTVDWVDETGAFAGGTIFPGPRLMAQALHTHTALLPLIDIDPATAHAPGRDTQAALNAGIVGAIVGGVRHLADELAQPSRVPPQRFLTGGGALLALTAWGFVHEPQLTLLGLADLIAD